MKRQKRTKKKRRLQPLPHHIQYGSNEFEMQEATIMKGFKWAPFALAFFMALMDQRRSLATGQGNGL
jgi:hypothetical protein